MIPQPIPRSRLEFLRDRYRDGLLDDVVPFWVEHAPDHVHGGFTFCLDQDGSILDTDKGMWTHGRFVWLLSTLAVECRDHVDGARRDEWLALASHGIDFIRRHGFDDDGRMFFQVTRDGQPLRKRRYLFTEFFGVAALAAFARATGDDETRAEARELFALIERHLDEPQLLGPPKVDAGTRPQQGLALPMITLVTTQILRHVFPQDAGIRLRADRAIDSIERHFCHAEFEAVLEVVGEHGEFLDHFDGRTLNPGHALEAGWFLLEEARLRGGDARLTELGTRIIDWMWRRGWDTEHGGILYFVDVRGLPVQEYWHDMKFWWPQNEATIATLMACADTGDPRYADWHQQIDDWMHAHFPDPEYGEWFGYLHRDGRRSSRLKGNLWKGPFHIPRMQLRCWQLCEELLAR